MSAVLIPKERIFQARRQLMDFLKLEPFERLDNYRTILKPAITRILSILTETENENNYPEIETLRCDALLIDVDIIAFHFGPNSILSYHHYKNVSQLTYPEVEYEVLEKASGLCKDQSTGKNFYSKRIAVDYAIETLAKKWLERLPDISELL